MTIGFHTRSVKDRSNGLTLLVLIFADLQIAEGGLKMGLQTSGESRTSRTKPTLS